MALAAHEAHNASAYKCNTLTAPLDSATQTSPQVRIFWRLVGTRHYFWSYVDCVCTETATSRLTSLWIRRPRFPTSYRYFTDRWNFEPFFYCTCSERRHSYFRASASSGQNSNVIRFSDPVSCRREQ